MITRPKRKSLNIGDSVLNGKYEILRVIHTNGMANVYLVIDKNLNKQWCLKEIVKSNTKMGIVEYQSLMQEAHIMKSLNHASIPRIVTIEDDGDSTFIIMDYVPGISVREWLRKKGVVEQEAVVKWMKQVCGVLIYLHNRKQPILYRDLKPDNIMIQEDSSIKVLDFGISVVISEENSVIEEALGTKGYAAPEQKKKGEKYDLRSDIYSFGKTMYYMLTGLNPSNLGKDIKPLREVNSSLSPGLEVIINKCTQDNPDDRYQSPEELLYALSNYDKIDSSYRDKSRKKVILSLGLLGLSFLLFICSFIPLGLHNSQLDEFYLKNLEKANVSGSTDDYISAIGYKPLELEPYIGLIDSIKMDGIFTKDEESKLLGLLNSHLEEIKKNKEYSKLAFNIGKLYWFYYESEDGDALSSNWLRDTLSLGYNVKEAKVYYDLSNFKKNISLSITESSDNGMYKEYWENLSKAKSLNSGEIVDLKLNTLSADFISNYASKLNSDGVSAEELLSEVDRISNFVSAYKLSSDKYSVFYDKLVSLNSTLREKVNSAYGLGGN